MKIAIVGTAGRKDDQIKMSRDLYFKMYRDVEKRIQEMVPERNKRHLVSGGAAWADHLAVSLYLADFANSLHLYLPCGFTNIGKCRFISNFKVADKAADVANYYHKLFSNKMGGDTLIGIDKARQKGAILDHSALGFLGRNLLVGQVDTLIAYTWGDGKVPKDEGTSHCWNHSKAFRKIHVPLASL